MTVTERNAYLESPTVNSGGNRTVCLLSVWRQGAGGVRNGNGRVTVSIYMAAIHTHVHNSHKSNNIAIVDGCY